jgi:hypothetical protein
MNEIFIVMGLVILIGLLPLLAVIFVAYRALKKSFDQIEAHLDTRFEAVEQTMEQIDDTFVSSENHIKKTIDVIKNLK